MPVSIPTDDFQNPLVKQIFFEIRFPSLFSIENKIGDFQLQIVEKFPQSTLLFRRQIVFTDLGPEVKAEDFEQNFDKGLSKKVWQFKSDLGKIDITTDSIVIASSKINKYSGTDGYRDLLEYVLSRFFNVMSIPLIKRIGLRYINEFEIGEMSSSKFNSLIKSSLPISRFTVENSNEMSCRIVAKINENNLTVHEAILTKNNKKTWILDLDSYMLDKESADYLAVADALHTVIKREFFKTIKSAIYSIMRT